MMSNTAITLLATTIQYHNKIFTLSESHLKLLSFENSLNRASLSTFFLKASITPQHLLNELLRKSLTFPEYPFYSKEISLKISTYTSLCNSQSIYL